eukprot:TRINITY_DN34707_c0_g1_i1.p1 TRINITY_DN34707_c0_g1~~TRINITY_DN34707_c0_g1_i1.p1  ORF type:complete len:571 (+),score=114.88 TRINITY_DN34707_c0_g1_i1:21-1733(+)
MHVGLVLPVSSRPQCLLFRRARQGIMLRIASKFVAALLVRTAAADVEAKSASADVAMLEAPEQGAPEADRSGDIVRGLTESFMGSGTMSQKESHCLAAGARVLTAEITRSCEEAVKSYRAASVAWQTATLAPMLLATPTWRGSGSNDHLSLQASSTPSQMTAGEETVITLEFAAKLAGILELERRLAKTCLQNDAVETLKQTAKHMSNLTYIGGRLMANGVDIFSELTEATSAFDAGNFRKFGQDLGGAWRKVLLSKKSQPQLEVPSEAELEEMTQALVGALLGRGLSLQIETDAAVPAMPMLRGGVYGSFVPTEPTARSHGSPDMKTPAFEAVSATAQPGSPYVERPQKINIDLKNCLAVNMPLFESAWSPVMKLFRDAASKKAPQAGLPDISQLLVSMLDLQLALRTCGLGPTQEAALLDAMRAGEVHTKLDVRSRERLVGPEVAEALSQAFAEALEDWQMHSWSAFGRQLGTMLRDMMVTTFPAKYSVKDLSHLRAFLHDSKVTTGKALPGLISFILLAAFPLALLAAIALVDKRLRLHRPQPISTEPAVEVECAEESAAELEAVVE